MGGPGSVDGLGEQDPGVGRAGSQRAASLDGCARERPRRRKSAPCSWARAMMCCSRVLGLAAAAVTASTPDRVRLVQRLGHCSSCATMSEGAAHVQCSRVSPCTLQECGGLLLGVSFEETASARSVGIVACLPVREHVRACVEAGCVVTYTIRAGTTLGVGTVTRRLRVAQ